MAYDRRTMHLMVEVEDPTEKDPVLARENVARFHYYAYRMDQDWPYAKDTVRRNFGTRMVCTKCGGREYNNPTLDTKDIKLLGKQMGLVVKIKQWRPADKCRENMRVGEVVKFEIASRWSLMGEVVDD